jgi:uncharacterized protein YggU (UPF0235/DUF167 family)
MSSVRLPLRVIPGAVRSSVQWFGEGLKVKVSAPPERGQANAAVLALLAKRLDLPQSALQIVAGHGSQQKVLEITGLDLATLRARLN